MLVRMSPATWITLGAFLAGCMSRSTDPLPPVVALITVDTWRADHFDAQHTPHLWSLASQGERWTDAWSPMGLTTPSHASMLTGLPPWEHGVRANNHHGYALPPDVPTVPEHPAFADWASGAFVSAYPAGPEGGLARGWDVFDGPEESERSGKIAVDAAMAWLPDDRAALLWVHLYEPHGPYEGRGTTEGERYAEEVRRADALLEPLLDVLVDRQARIVVASDHGEVHGEEKCGWQHERSSHDVVLRVPLFRWTPERRGLVHTDRIGLTDVPALLRDELPAARPHWLAESGTCEPGCTGCSPQGLEGRDAVVISSAARLTRRPGKAVLKKGAPSAELEAALASIPALTDPTEGANEASLEALGYQEPSAP